MGGGTGGSGGSGSVPHALILFVPGVRGDGDGMGAGKAPMVEDANGSRRLRKSSGGWRCVWVWVGVGGRMVRGGAGARGERLGFWEVGEVDFWGRVRVGAGVYVVRGEGEGGWGYEENKWTV